jgi:hypothetical protein
MKLPLRFFAAGAFSILVSSLSYAAQTGATLEAPGPQGPLRGAVAGPGTADAPAVLIIPGSGPTDRDGNSPAGLKASTYRLLAEGLAANGITSVRVDKRGLFSSAGAVADPNDVTIPDYARDIHSWINVIRKRTGRKCVWVLGHSEGGLVALVAAQEQPADICGLILLATPGRPLGAVLREQLSANPAIGPLLPEALRIITALEHGQSVADISPPLRPLFRPQIQHFLMSALSYDPAQLIGKLKMPVLIIQGMADLQVSAEDAAALKDAQPQAALQILFDVNHVLKHVSGSDRRANLATYADPNLPLADGVVSPITNFIRAH